MANRKEGKKAVFLDRDGTIVRYADLLVDLKKVKILPGVGQAIKKMNDLGYLVIVVTNQPVIARGLISEAGIERMNQMIAGRLSASGGRVDAWYVCPHHPKATLPRYRMRCGCRKPGAGLLRRAAREHGIDLEKSFMVGDAIIDMEMGRRAGTKNILVQAGPGHARLDKLYAVKPDFIAKDLLAASKIVLNGSS